MISRQDIHLWFCARNSPEEIIGGYVGVSGQALTFSRGEFGKPRLVPVNGRGLSFNQSHAGDRHLLALSSMEDDNRIGVDLVDVAALSQLNSPNCRELLTDHFPAMYSVWYSDEECVRAFARLWTQSEAILKALGCGLNHGGMPLSCCSLNAPAGIWREVVCEDEVLLLIDMEVKPGYHSALAVPAVYSSRDVFLFEQSVDDSIPEIKEARLIAS